MQNATIVSNGLTPSFNRQHFFSSLKFGFLPLYSAVVISLIIDQSLNLKIETILRSPDGLSNSIWIWGGLSLISTLIFPVLFTLSSCFFITEKIKGLSISQFPVFLKQHFELTLLESMRAWAYMFLWFFVLFFPMVYKFVSYTMTPFLVVYSPAYARGEINALKTSELITKEFFIKLFLLLVCFYIILPTAGTLIFDQYKLFRNYPFQSLALAGIDAFLIYTIHFFILKMFFKSKFFKGDSDGINV